MFSKDENMTISKSRVVLIFLPAILALGSICLGFALASETKSSTAFRAPANGVSAPEPTPPVDTPAVNVNKGENTTAHPVPGVPDKRSKLMDREAEKSWRKVVSSTGLQSLERTKLLPNDVEIRVWHIPGLYRVNTTCWVFSRKAGRWTAAAFVDQDFKGKIIGKSLEASFAGLQTWDAYVNRDLTRANINRPRPEPKYGSEGMGVMLEVKFGEDYTKKYFALGQDLVGALFTAIKSVFFNKNGAELSKY
jgi:hypothetical protein